MTGVEIAIASFEREADEWERYLRENGNRTCSECGRWESCPCGCGWGACMYCEDDVMIFGDERAVRDYECPHFEERKDNE